MKTEPKTAEEFAREYFHHGPVFDYKQLAKLLESYHAQFTGEEWISARCVNCNVPEIAHGSECGWQNAQLLVMPGGKHVINWNGKDDNKENWEWLIKTINSLRAGNAKQMIADFKKWYDKLPQIDKFSVHPPAGSGCGIGLYHRTDEDLIEEFFRNQEKETNGK